MKVARTIIIFFSVALCGVVNAKEVEIYGGLWGGWKGWAGKTSGYYACGAELRFEDPGGDDTAGNGLKLRFCDLKNWNSKKTTTVYSGKWGGWKGMKMCPFGKYIGGARVRFEDRQGGGDDTALNGLEIRCVDRYWKGTENIMVYEGVWGDWKPWVNSAGNLVEDARVRFEDPGGDDTALNGIRFWFVSVLPPSLTWKKWKNEKMEGKKIDNCQGRIGSYCERRRTWLATENCNTYSEHFDVCNEILQDKCKNFAGHTSADSCDARRDSHKFHEIGNCKQKAKCIIDTYEQKQCMAKIDNCEVVECTGSKAIDSSCNKCKYESEGFFFRYNNNNNCGCGRCQNLPETEQTRSGIAKISYKQIPPKNGLRCNERLHPINTKAEVICDGYPFSFPRKKPKCTKAGEWSQTLSNGEDYCTCAVECSNGRCLGVNGYKTSITDVQFHWESTVSVKLSWNDGCLGTSDPSYLIDIYRSYWSEESKKWTKWYSIGVVKGQTDEYITDSAVEADFPEDGDDYSPGLRIRYRWSQKTKTNDQAEINIFQDLSEQVSAEVTLPFFFTFSYFLTSPDGTVDIAGATLSIVDMLSEEVLITLETKERDFTDKNEKGEPEEITVQIPISDDIASFTREVKVSITFDNHTIVCDQPFCDQQQNFWIGNVAHMEKSNFFFTDLSVGTIKGKVKNRGCPVDGVNFRVKSSNGIKEFMAATDEKGYYEIFAPFGEVEIEPFFDDHKFESLTTSESSSYKAQIKNDISGLDFSDTTTRFLTTRVLGGDSTCNASVGSGYVSLQVPGGCYKEYLTTGSDPQTHEVPSLNFNLKVEAFNTNGNYQWKWENDQSFTNFEEFMIATKQYNNLKVREVDATSENVIVTFRYHSIITVGDINLEMNRAEDINLNCTNQGINAVKETGNETDPCDSPVKALNDDTKIWYFKHGAGNQTIEFEATERYGGKDCAAHGLLRIEETFSSIDSTYNELDLPLDEDGKVYFEFSPGSPEFGCPFTKSFFYSFILFDSDISVMEKYDEPNFVTKFETKAIIGGQAEALEESMHLTFPTSIYPLMILRDPPGANSFSSYTESNEISVDVSVKAGYSGAQEGEGQSAFGSNFAVGLGFETENELYSGLAGKVASGRSQSKQQAKSFTLKTSRTIKSSEDPALTGKYGDVIVGLGVVVNIVPSYEIKWEKDTCTVFSSHALGFDSDVATDDQGNVALYTYTHWYIESVKIPELKMIESNKGESEENREKARNEKKEWESILNDKDNANGIGAFQEGAAIWNIIDEFIDGIENNINEVKDGTLQALAAANTIASGAAVTGGLIASANVGGILKGIIGQISTIASSTNFLNFTAFEDEFDNFKLEYKELKSLAISGGEETSLLTIDGGHSFSASTIISDGLVTSREFDLDIASEWGPFSKVKTSASDAESKVVTKATIEFQRSVKREDATSRSFEWTIHDPDIGDHYLIDIKEDKTYGSPMFKVRSGRSLCRHEENTVAREGVEIAVEGANRRENLDPFKQAVFLIKLRHTGYDPVYPWYNIRLVRSRMKGFTGLVTLGGHPLTNFIEFTNLEKDQWVTVELVVHRSYTSYFFEDLTLEMYSQCEDSFSRNNMPVDIIHDTVSLSANWVEPCADVEIQSDVDFVSIKSSSVIPFPIEISNPDHQVRPWYEVNGLELRLVWKVWTPDNSISATYAQDENDQELVKTQEDLKREMSSKSQLNWDIAALNDGKYTLEIEMKCPNRNPEYTEPKIVHIHREDLQVAGYTQPSDLSVFSFDEDIIVRFNRELNCYNPNMAFVAKIEGNKTDIYEIPLHVLCNGNTIIAVPTINTDLLRIASKDLRFTLTNVMDFAGNFLNSVDGESSYNGISWLVKAQDADTISTFPARLSMCINEDIALDASNGQLEMSKLALKKSIHQTFGYLRGIHSCRFTVSDPYNFDSACPNKRWDLIIHPSSSLSEECVNQISLLEGQRYLKSTNNDTDALSPFYLAKTIGSGIQETDETNIPLIDRTKPIGLSLTSSSISISMPKDDEITEEDTVSKNQIINAGVNTGIIAGIAFACAIIAALLMCILFRSCRSTEETERNKVDQSWLKNEIP